MARRSGCRPSPPTSARTPRSAALIVSPATATKLGISPTLDERLLTLSRPAHQGEIDAARSLLLARSTHADGDFELTVHETLDDSKLLLVPLALLAISTLVTFGVTAISTSLSAAESKGDFATLSAIGAQPAVRRRLAIGQAAVLALLGGVLGIAAGLVPMAAVIAVRSDVLDFTVPWQVIALALVGVPVVAGLGAGRVHPGPAAARPAADLTSSPDVGEDGCMTATQPEPEHPILLVAPTASRSSRRRTKATSPTWSSSRPR